MSLTLTEFFLQLDLHADRVPLNELTGLLDQLDIGLDDVDPYLHFGGDHYRRNLMHEGVGYQALVLCWKAGQESPIHDHRGSSCGVRVLQGTATEIIYDTAPDGRLLGTRTSHLQASQVCGSQDLDKHIVANRSQDGTPLVTLHVYSPPLLRMGTYEVRNGFLRQVREFEDPVHKYVHEAQL